MFPSTLDSNGTSSNRSTADDYPTFQPLVLLTTTHFNDTFEQVDVKRVFEYK